MRAVILGLALTGMAFCSTARIGEAIGPANPSLAWAAASYVAAHALRVKADAWALTAIGQALGDAATEEGKGQQQ